jgi:hypothetical protein
MQPLHVSLNDERNYVQDSARHWPRRFYARRRLSFTITASTFGIDEIL